jgi:large subunit ribosomal protein L6
VNVPNDVKVTILDDFVKVVGKLGELTVKIIPGVTYKLDNNVISANGEDVACVGTAMRLVGNAVSGVNALFEKKLEVHDANVRAKQDGRDLVLNVGYSHDVRLAIPIGITVEIDSSNKRYVVLSIKSMDKKQIGDFVDVIRSVKKSRVYGDFCMKIVGQPFYIKKPKGK